MNLLCSHILLGLCLLLGAGCDEQSPAGLPVVEMKIGKGDFVIEVARTPAEQETGLMKRDSMPKDHGMIFVFSGDEVRKFWMKDTRFPLDILFLDAGGKVVSIHQMKAYDLQETSSDYPARYAIELNDGTATETGVKSGDVLEIPNQARSSK